MIRSLLARLTLLEQLTAVVVIVAFGLLSLGITARVLRSERRAFVARTADRLARSIETEFVEEADTAEVARSLMEDGQDVGVRVEVRDPAGRVLAASRRTPTADSASAARSDGWFVASAANRDGFRVTVSASNAVMQLDLLALVRALGLAALPILVLSVLLGRAMVARALRPLSVMADRAATISIERNPRSLGAHSGLSEIDQLAGSFDRLLQRLDDAMQAERRLTADASHELRTPLTTLGGELELLLEAEAPGSPSAPGLQRASEQVGAMRDLVEAILLLHRSGEHGREGPSQDDVINLCDLAREALAEARARYRGRAGDLQLNAPDEILVHGQSTLLASAVRNLLDNALKFTQAGQQVVVEVAASENEALLTVDDQGPGIPEAERERVFDPFFRGTRARVGTSGFGLGLPILRRIARVHGGDSEVAGSPLGGARVVLRLPRLKATG